MSLTKLALDNARLTVLAVIFIVAAGIGLYLNFPSSEDPEITIREAVVTAFFPGMAPDRVEDLITTKLEEEIRQISEVKHIESSSKTGMSIVHVLVHDRFFDLDPIWQDLRNRMEDIASELPDGTIGPEVDDDFGEVFSATIALTSRGFTLAEMRETARDIRDELYTVRGIKTVELHGIQDERVFLETTNAQLAQFGLSPTDLVQALQTQNIIQPGGKVDTGTREIIVEPTGSFENVEDIGKVLLSIPATEEVVSLGDIVTVTRAYVDPPEKPVYFNGEQAIVIAASTMDGENILEFGPRLRKRVDEIQQRLPIGYVLDFATYQTEFVEKSVDSVTINVYQTLAIVLVVVMLFLGIRTGLIVGAIVPLTMLLTLIVMRIVEIDLQRVSLATLIIALGLLVDNGIVIAEDIRRRLGEGVARRDAAVDTGRELALPLLTSSLTTILAFMPLMLADNVSGEYTLSLSLVLLITLLSSWLLAMCVTPLMGYWFIGAPKTPPDKVKRGYEDGFYRSYRGALAFILRIRPLFMALMLAGLVGAVYLMQFVPKQFFPSSDRNQLQINVQLPAGYGTRATDAEVRRILAWIGDKEINPSVRSHVAYVGYGGPRFFLSLSPTDPDPHVAYILVTTETTEQVGDMIGRTRAHLLHSFPKVSARVKKFSLGSSETGLVEMRLSGPDSPTLAGFADRAIAAMRRIPGTIDIRNNWENRIAKVVVRVDQARARRAGVSSQEIAASLNGFLSGDEITDYREGDTVIPVVLRAEGAERYNLDRVRTINIYSASRQSNVPLFQIADFEPVNQFSRIERRDLERTITVEAKSTVMQAADFEKALAPLLAPIRADMPSGYAMEFGGETESSAEAQAALFKYVPECFALIIVLMVWQFNSFRKPLIIFLTIPLSFIGAVLGLLAVKAYFGFMSMLGLFSLAGIIINNAIVLLDRIQLERDAGTAPYDAVVNACVRRLRPIMMTTLTTVLGLMPIILSKDPLFFSMAIVIAFGLGIGTVLTLGVVPVLYTWFYRVPVGAPAVAA